MMTAFAGAVVWRGRDVEASVEFLRRSLPGVSAAEIRRWVVSAERDGQSIRVRPALDARLQTQTRAHRGSVAAARCGPRAHPVPLHTGVPARDVGRCRGWRAAGQGVVGGGGARHEARGNPRRAGQAALQLGFNWREVLPETEITASLHSVIAQFKKLRLPQWWEGQPRPCHQEKMNLLEVKNLKVHFPC